MVQDTCQLGGELSNGLLRTGEIAEQVYAMEAVEHALLPKMDEMATIQLGEEEHGSHRGFSIVSRGGDRDTLREIQGLPVR